MNQRLLFITLVVAGPTAPSAMAIDSGGLAALMTSGEKVTIVDARSTDFYVQAHIPHAINIPAAICADKPLPPIGRVVVYDQGLSQTNAAVAAAALNRKPGITAEVLEGGFAAWQSTQRETTAGRGVFKEQLPQIDYHALKSSSSADVVLVDLRTAAPGGALKSDAPPLTNLGAEFPGMRVTRSPFETLNRTKSTGATPPLLVLIDRGDGKAEEMARALRANGMNRIAILTGGEEILTRQGQSGLQRAGGAMTVPAPLLSPPPAAAR